MGRSSVIANSFPQKPSLRKLFNNKSQAGQGPYKNVVHLVWNCGTFGLEQVNPQINYKAWGVTLDGHAQKRRSVTLLSAHTTYYIHPTQCAADLTARLECPKQQNIYRPALGQKCKAMHVMCASIVVQMLAQERSCNVWVRSLRNAGCWYQTHSL